MPKLTTLMQVGLGNRYYDFNDLMRTMIKGKNLSLYHHLIRVDKGNGESVMEYYFDFRVYQRRFRQPLITSHGVWKVREGIILKLTNDKGKIGWGEIALLPWFGSETLIEAVAFCQQIGNRITEQKIKAIPEQLPACQFGFESALKEISLSPVKVQSGRINYSYLLSAGETALEEWKAVWERGGKTFKWKIAVGRIEEEIIIFKKLVEQLPTGVKLRLDANGGLNIQEAETWLKVTDELSCVEFIEQPLSPEEFDLMLALSQAYKTPLALDESVATLRQLTECYERGWRGIFVIKPAIAGFPSRLREFCQTHPIDLVFSSVFETAIGRKSVLNLAEELRTSGRAIGFGVDDWFEGNEKDWLEQLWKTF